GETTFTGDTVDFEFTNTGVSATTTWRVSANDGTGNFLQYWNTRGGWSPVRDTAGYAFRQVYNPVDGQYEFMTASGSQAAGSAIDWKRTLTMFPEGKIGATEYCDDSGRVCFTANIPECVGNGLALGWDGTRWTCNSVSGGGGLPICGADPTPVFVDVVTESQTPYLFSQPGRVRVHLIGAGGSGGLSVVDSGRESIGTGGGAGAFASFIIPDAQSLGPAEITLGSGGTPIRNDNWRGFYGRGNPGGDSVFRLGSYEVRAGGGEGGSASRISPSSRWNDAYGVSGGRATANSAAQSLPELVLNDGGDSSDCSVRTGSNDHGATGGAAPNLGVGANYNGRGECDQRGGQSVAPSTNLFSTTYRNLMQKGGGLGERRGRSAGTSRTPQQMAGGPGAGGGGAGREGYYTIGTRTYAGGMSIYNSGAGGDGLAVVYYYNCRES
ncbi:MAG: glycine-rich domain-containing protein, partial [Patescibacteria group bacterium]